MLDRPRKESADEQPSPNHVEALADNFRRVRDQSADLVQGLQAEDSALQSMPDTSPSKWHLAHTTWFFEQFILSRDPDYQPFNARWNFLFNSYYQSVGPMHARPQRGLLSRPTLSEVLDYRKIIDERMFRLIERENDSGLDQLLTLGLHHEQQHQELLLTDIKHLFSLNPLEPAFRDRKGDDEFVTSTDPLVFIPGQEGLHPIGHEGSGFAFDCETPRHPVLLRPHALANRPISNGEYRDFIEQGGYRDSMLWLSQGWATVQEQQWQHPLYWSDDLETEFTLSGRQPIDPAAPVCHVSYFEADAFARWAGKRLPQESEWEIAAQDQRPQGNFLEQGHLHPVSGPTGGENDSRPFQQLFGDVWEWTGSPFTSYPGFRSLDGSLGEYNGKFMCGQFVLRGGSCATPESHIRASYRNFFYPPDRWQFMGFRLAKDTQ